jgi:DNA-directed RNA polymerase subunit omega
MARITVEDCLRKVESRFELVLLAAGRVKMLLRGAKPVVESENKEVVTALREIAEGKVYFVKPDSMAEQIGPVEKPTSLPEPEDTDSIQKKEKPEEATESVAEPAE